MDKLRMEFEKPSLDLRGAPFWSWNDRLDPVELARQVRDMKAHGMGGFFMHSRDGLETVYMGPEWRECVRRTVDIATQEGMGAWLYDEDRWPSGAAGGLVPQTGGDAFRAKVITMEMTTTAPPPGKDLLALYRARIENGALQYAERLDPRQTACPAADETYLVFRREISGPSEWFNQDAYADNLNPEAVRCFIETTYEPYYQEVGDAFGKAVPGIFTDEPNVFAVEVRSGRPALPWTDGLPAFYRERRGHDLLDTLPWLFLPGDRDAKARHDYWFTISQRFTEAYSRQISDWCEEHGLAFTGHYLMENDLGMGTLRGGAIMPHYRYQHVPGIDMLTEQNHEVLTVKQCSSVASQLGRKRVLSELYGCTSWEFTFEGQKWVGDWQYVLGVNLRCQHLALYTLRGCRKRDYPPAFNYNTTWWPYNGVVEDYFARVGRVLTEGEAVRDVLMIHPIATVWAMLGQGKEQTRQADLYGERLNGFLEALLATHYDCDLGDEQIMAEESRIQGRELWVGKRAYRVAVIPEETTTLLGSTVTLLESLLDNGGRVIVAGDPPSMIEAEPSERIRALWQHRNVVRIVDRRDLQSALEACVPRRVSLRTTRGQEAASVLYMQRSCGGRNMYFVFNGDRANGYDLEVTLQGQGRLEEWDPLTGAIAELSGDDGVPGNVRFATHLAPAGSRIFVIDPASTLLPGPSRTCPPHHREQRTARNTCFIGPSCRFSRADPNILTLDMCRYSLEGAPLSEEMEVWRAQDAIRSALGMRSNYYNGLPQRYKWAVLPHAADGAPVSLHFGFRVEQVPSEPVHLLVEGAEQFEMALNGVPFESTATGWYLDRSMHRVALPPLAAGHNELSLLCRYTNHMELEDIYLLGDFGVSIDRAIIAEPTELHFGDWTTQGYPHYAGAITYHGSYEHVPAAGCRTRLYLGRHEAVHVAVAVNGNPAGHIPWTSANGLDITEALQEGENAIDITVVGSPRNMLGPLHLATGREPWTDWRAFRRTDETFTPSYVLKPWGLIEQVHIRQEQH
ncbi:MAG: hypothetical protein GXX94_03620 [Chloroflexi bacterium]|nr:hypothetical protein [Chloroflexota bacterium]